MLSFTSYTKAGLRLGNLFWRLLRRCELYRSSHISDHETLILGPLYGGYGTASHRNVLSWFCPDLFIGLLGEYIMSINTRVMHRPLVVEEERINFDTPAGAQEEV